jgi:hypothetical protein
MMCADLLEVIIVAMVVVVVKIDGGLIIVTVREGQDLDFVFEGGGEAGREREMVLKCHSHCCVA